MKELFRKVYICSEADLPKIKGDYFVSIKGLPLDENSFDTWFKWQNKEDNDYWLNTFGWYLQPIEQEQQSLPEDEIPLILNEQEKKELDILRIQQSDSNSFMSSERYDRLLELVKREFGFNMGYKNKYGNLFQLPNGRVIQGGLNGNQSHSPQINESLPEDERNRIIKVLKNRVQNLIANDLISPLFYEDFADEIINLQPIEQEQPKNQTSISAKKITKKIVQEFEALRLELGNDGWEFVCRKAIELGDDLALQNNNKEQQSLPEDKYDKFIDKNNPLKKPLKKAMKQIDDFFKQNESLPEDEKKVYCLSCYSFPQGYQLPSNEEIEMAMKEHTKDYEMVYQLTSDFYAGAKWALSQIKAIDLREELIKYDIEVYHDIHTEETSKIIVDEYLKQK